MSKHPIEYQLCYIEGNLAHFLSVPPSLVWGDDWDDVPYEHNAGTPYLTRTNAETDIPVDSVVVAFRCDSLETPAERACGNSSYSVQMINAGHVAWLATSQWYGGVPFSIHAGTTVRDFISTIEQAGGEVYIPMRLAAYYGAAV